MNCGIPPLKVWIENKHLTQSDAPGYEQGYAFALQSYKGRAAQFHVLLESGAHFRHIPLHWLYTAPDSSAAHTLSDLQLWDCFSYRPITTVFDFLRDYEVTCILRNGKAISGKYHCTIDWLPDSDADSGVLLHPDQNKCAHLCLLDDGQCAFLPTNRILFKDAFFVGNLPTAATKGYKTLDTVWTAETSDRWSVADTDETFY